MRCRLLGCAGAPGTESEVLRAALQCAEAEAGGCAAVLARAQKLRPGRTLPTPPLLRAAWHGHVSVVGQLVRSLPDGDDSGARAARMAFLDAQAKARGGYTALMVACEQGHADVVGLLVEQRCDIELCNDAHATAWDCALAAEQLEVNELLKRYARSAATPRWDPAALRRERERLRTAPAEVSVRREDSHIIPFWNLTGWGVADDDLFPNWRLLKRGAQGAVHLIQRVHPRVWRADVNRRQRKLDEFVLKRALSFDAAAGGDTHEELRNEYLGLVQLRHQYIVQVIGTTHGRGPALIDEDGEIIIPPDAPESCARNCVWATWSPPTCLSRTCTHG
jgi:hypothetical protein